MNRATGNHNAVPPHRAEGKPGGGVPAAPVVRRADMSKGGRIWHR